jgi:hypothetical protein
MFWVRGLKGEPHLDPGEVTSSWENLHCKETTQENERRKAQNNIQ